MATTVRNEEAHPVEFVVSDAYSWRSYDNVVLIQGQTAVLKVGTILGKITASGKFTEMLPAAVDGSEVSAAILCYDTDATGAVDITVAVVARDAAVLDSKLVFEPSGTILVAERAAGIVELAANGIVARTSEA